MKSFSFFISFFWACQLFAQDIHQDGMGYYIGEDAVRKNWAGLVITCDGLDCVTVEQGAEALERIDFFLGQKSQRAGKDNFMALGVFEDRFGNLIPEGRAEVMVDNGDRRNFINIHQGIAQSVFTARHKAGYVAGSMRSRGIESERELYRIIPDLNSLRPNIDLPESGAKQGSVLTIRTNEMRDAYNNEAPIGTSISGLFKGEDGRENLMLMSAQGRFAETVINTRKLKGDYQFQLNLLKLKSQADQFFIKPEMLTKYTSLKGQFDPKSGMILISMGGIQTETGNLIQDGLPMILEIKDAEGKTQSHQIWTFNGGIKARISVSIDPFPITGSVKGDYGELEFMFQESDTEPLND